MVFIVFLLGNCALAQMFCWWHLDRFRALDARDIDFTN